MICPTCGHGEHRVLRTDAGDGRIQRTRECVRCGKRWHTAEVTADVLAKANEIREAYRKLGQAVGEE
jgi:transcriptional regulator NrdR family protein